VFQFRLRRALRYAGEHLGQNVLLAGRSVGSRPEKEFYMASGLSGLTRLCLGLSQSALVAQSHTLPSVVKAHSERLHLFCVSTLNMLDGECIFSPPRKRQRLVSAAKDVRGATGAVLDGIAAVGTRLLHVVGDNERLTGLQDHVRDTPELRDVFGLVFVPVKDPSQSLYDDHFGIDVTLLRVRETVPRSGCLY